MSVNIKNLELASLEFDANYGHIVSTFKELIVSAAKLAGSDADAVPPRVDLMIRKSIEAGYTAGFDSSQDIWRPLIEQMLAARCSTMRLIREAISVTDDEEDKRKLLVLLDSIIEDYDKAHREVAHLFEEKE